MEIDALDAQILEKPRDAADALRMLRSLSGRQHSVITGVAVVRPTGAGNPGTERPEAEANPEAEAEVNPDAEVNREVHPEVDAEVTLFHEEARVTFLPLSEAQLRDYVATGEPLDKAGAYGLQGGAAAFAERVEGDALAAVGFPLRQLPAEAAAFAAWARWNSCCSWARVSLCCSDCRSRSRSCDS